MSVRKSRSSHHITFSHATAWHIKDQIVLSKLIRQKNLGKNKNTIYIKTVYLSKKTKNCQA